MRSHLLRAALSLPIVFPAAAALALSVGCSADNSSYAGSPSVDAGAAVDAATGRCISSNECPVGWTCSEFGTCEPPPVTGPDAGLPPEVEVQFSAPSSTLRYVYV